DDHAPSWGEATGANAAAGAEGATWATAGHAAARKAAAGEATATGEAAGEATAAGVATAGKAAATRATAGHAAAVLAVALDGVDGVLDQERVNAGDRDDADRLRRVEGAVFHVLAQRLDLS